MQAASLSRTLDLDCTPDELWRLVTEPASLAHWLGSDVELEAAPGSPGRVVDDDGIVRHLVVRQVVDGERLAFTWWTDDAESESSEVVFDVEPADRGSRLIVTETVGAGASSWDARLVSLWLSVCALARA